MISQFNFWMYYFRVIWRMWHNETKFFITCGTENNRGGGTQRQREANVIYLISTAYIE